MRGRSVVLCIAALAIVAAPAGADGERRSTHRTHAHALTSLDVVAAANDAARQRPAASGFQEARHVYAFQPGAIYELYTNPTYVSAILLEPGEEVSAAAAGDTARWLVTRVDGEGDARSIILVKPQAPDLRTNIMIITNRRQYQIEAVSQSGSVYSAQIAWSYPADSEQEASASPMAQLNFDYRVRAVRGPKPRWMPVRVFDDGRRTWIEFPPDVVATDMPPLFVITADGAELVNYRVQGTRYMIDRVFDTAELRLGTRAQTIVRIERGPHVSAPTSLRRGLHP